MRAHTMRKRARILVVIAAILILPLLGFLSAFYSTHRRMEEFRTRVVSGMSVQELRDFAVGQPRFSTAESRCKRPGALTPCRNWTSTRLFTSILEMGCHILTSMSSSMSERAEFCAATSRIFGGSVMGPVGRLPDNNDHYESRPR